MAKTIIETFTDAISETVSQKSAYVDIGGTYYVVRHNYENGTPEEDIDIALSAKIDAFEPPVLQLSDRRI